MTSDCWSDEDYQYVLGNVKHHLWLYVYAGATIEELKNIVQNLTMLERKEIDYLSIVHFLLSDEVRKFVQIMPRILRRLSHATQKEVIMNRGCVKGRIDWALTIKERCVQGYDHTIFVCRPPSRIYNLPENQLLKFILTQIKRLIETTTGLPKVEEKNIKLEELRTSDGKEMWTDRLFWLRFHVNRALKNIHLREVDVPTRVNERMLRRARTARNKDYESAVGSHFLYRLIIERPNEKKLREIIEKRILKPLKEDTLYELFVLFEIMDALGKPEELSLIRSGVEAVGTYRIKEETVRVYFQKVKGLFGESKYKQIFDDYELNVGSRRPDIILHFEKKSKFVIVEVKRTKDRDYIVDSVYKVLGYLADFEKYFRYKQKPKGLLVVWNIQRVKESEQEVSILAHNEVEAYIKELVSK